MWEFGLLIFGLIVTGVIGIFAYIWQERTERNTELAGHRKELYEKVLRALFELLILEGGTDRSKLASEIEKGWLFASDAVLLTCYEYMELFDRLCKESTQTILSRIKDDLSTRKEFENIIAKIFLAMRRDLKGIRFSKINSDWAHHHVKIYDWGIISCTD